MKKYSDLEKKDKEVIESQIKSGASKLGVDDWSVGSDIRSKEKDDFGICSDCEFRKCAKTRYLNVFAFCGIFKMELNQQDPIVECTNYNKRGEMELHEMYNMAILIDAKPKRRIGMV